MTLLLSKVPGYLVGASGLRASACLDAHIGNSESAFWFPVLVWCDGCLPAPGTSTPGSQHMTAFSTLLRATSRTQSVVRVSAARKALEAVVYRLSQPCLWETSPESFDEDSTGSFIRTHWGAMVARMARQTRFQAKISGRAQHRTPAPLLKQQKQRGPLSVRRLSLASEYRLLPQSPPQASFIPTQLTFLEPLKAILSLTFLTT